ncbi:hypothetical protein Tco_0305437 [Tanacetum coccineum]
MPSTGLDTLESSSTSHSKSFHLVTKQLYQTIYMLWMTLYQDKKRGSCLVPLDDLNFDEDSPEVNDDGLQCCWFVNFDGSTLFAAVQSLSQSASIVFVFLLLLDVALVAAHSPVSILKLTSEDLFRNLKLTVSNSSLGEDC